MLDHDPGERIHGCRRPGLAAAAQAGVARRGVADRDARERVCCKRARKGSDARRANIPHVQVSVTCLKEAATPSTKRSGSACAGHEASRATATGHERGAPVVPRRGTPSASTPAAAVSTVPSTTETVVTGDDPEGAGDANRNAEAGDAAPTCATNGPGIAVSRSMGTVLALGVARHVHTTWCWWRTPATTLLFTVPWSTLGILASASSRESAPALATLWYGSIAPGLWAPHFPPSLRLAL